MGSLQILANKFNSVDINDIVDKILRDKERFIVELNREQLRAGLLSNGDKTAEHTFGSISTVYVSGKLDKGLIRSSTLPNVNLFNTGAFHGSFKLKITPNYISIYATDPKTDELMGAYTTFIFGLTEKSLTLLRGVIKPLVVNEFKRQIL